MYEVPSSRQPEESLKLSIIKGVVISAVACAVLGGAIEHVVAAAVQEMIESSPLLDPSIPLGDF